MSGIYLIVTDNKYTDSKVLRPTTGGYPHITVFHSGSHISAAHLKKLASKALLMRFYTLTPENAKINTFFHEKQKQQRFDVLLYLDQIGQDEIQSMRQYAYTTLDNSTLGKLSTSPPHVTHSIHWSEAEAQAALEEVKKHLPIKIQTTGFTIK